MEKSHDKGKAHVLDVYNALIGKDIDHPTAKYIKEKYPSIQKVEHKYEHSNPDLHSDLKITLQNDDSVNINLFSIKGTAKIQPKNLGAKSFISRYFYNEYFQQLFNETLENELKIFFKEILSTENKTVIYDTSSILRKEVKNTFTKFTKEINSHRTGFLIRIRDVAFNVLKETYNANNESLRKTFDELMMVDAVNIITRFKNGIIFKVEEWKVEIDYTQPLEIYKKGVSTIGLRIGKDALTLRFKFESSPHTSIKLASSYEKFQTQSKVELENLRTVKLFNNELSKHVFNGNKNDSNAIGKCNEAIVYYQMVKKNPSIEQVDDSVFIGMFKTYSSSVSNEIITDLAKTASPTVEAIQSYLYEKHGDYILKSIELVPDSYIKDRLDTSDLKLGFTVGNQYVEEGLSLKAIARKTSKITVKNPGAGQILGPQYFGVGSLEPTIKELKIEFEKGTLTHQDCLKKVSEEIGETLVVAAKKDIQKGVIALLGEQTKVISVYKTIESSIIELKNVGEYIKVKSQYPSDIQTTFIDPENNFELSLRVKFSAGQSKGWSSLKLAAEMRIN